MKLLNYILKKIALGFLYVYQNGISPLVGAKYTCNFVPTCSEYTRLAIIEHGVFKGSLMGVNRIRRCGPNKERKLDLVPKNLNKDKNKA